MNLFMMIWDIRSHMVLMLIIQIHFIIILDGIQMGELFLKNHELLRLLNRMMAQGILVANKMKSIFFPFEF